MIKRTVLLATVALAFAGQAEAFNPNRGNTYSVVPKDYNFKMESALLPVVRSVPNYTDGHGNLNFTGPVPKPGANSTVKCGYTTRQVNADDYRGFFRRLINPRSRAVYEKSYECQTVYTQETIGRPFHGYNVTFRGRDGRLYQIWQPNRPGPMIRIKNWQNP